MRSYPPGHGMITQSRFCRRVGYGGSVFYILLQDIKL